LFHYDSVVGHELEIDEDFGYPHELLIYNSTNDIWRRENTGVTWGEFKHSFPPDEIKPHSAYSIFNSTSGLNGVQGCVKYRARDTYMVSIGWTTYYWKRDIQIDVINAPMMALRVVPVNALSMNSDIHSFAPREDPKKPEPWTWYRSRVGSVTAVQLGYGLPTNDTHPSLPSARSTERSSGESERDRSRGSGRAER
jgi:hypothetical protein